MAQTWPVSRVRLAALKSLDRIARAAVPRRVSHDITDRSIKRILVIEPWNIGDVVLVTPLLAALRARFPEAQTYLLAQSHARDLLEGSGLVDGVIVADLPWTAQKRKYTLTPAVIRRLRALIEQLREGNFDVTIDARMDIRSNLLASTTGAPRRVGYDIGGGGWLLTDTLSSVRDETHKIDDWLDLISCVDSKLVSSHAGRPKPALRVNESERGRAQNALAAVAGDAQPTIGYHPGGSHPGKRWPQAHFLELIARLQASLGGRHVVFLGPDEKEFSSNTAVIRPTLRELMAFTTCCDVIVTNDSGPMHIADALGVPVVAIFEVGNPQWFGPSGDRARVVRGDRAGTGVSAAPLDEPPPNPVAVSRVAAAVTEVLAERAPIFSMRGS